MDRKSIIVLVISFLLLILWFPLLNYLGFVPKPVPASTNVVDSVTHQSDPGTNGTAAAPSAHPPVPAGPSEALVPPGAPEESMTIENEQARYVFTSHGGGIKQVELKGYPETVGCAGEKRGATNKVAVLNAQASLPVLAILGGEAVQGDGIFQLIRTPAGLRAEKVLSNGLHVVKEFRPSSNFLVAVTVRLENRAGQSMTLPAQQWVVGTATPLGLTDETAYMGGYWFNGSKAEHVDQGFFSDTSFCFVPRRVPAEYRHGTSNVVWTAVHNQFFALGLIPEQRAEAVVVVKTNLPPPTEEELKEYPKAVPKPFGFQARVVYPSLTLAPNQSFERQLHIYAGPRKYGTVTLIAAQFRNEFERVMGYSGPFGFFSHLLLSSMNGLHAMGLGYGLAIIVITIIIKLLFWPLTNASTKSMKRMAALQPQMKALQEKYKDDPAKMNRKLMEFMKEHKVSPLGGCLPMLLQIPVFIGFYQMIQSAIELRGARFLWACDLSKSDTLFIIPGMGFIPFIGLHGVGLPVNPLPLLMGVTMLWQARLTPPSPGMDPMQQKIMKYMPLMFLFILYNFSAGLTLYWTVQNLLTIAQMKLTKTKTETPAAAPAAKPVSPMPAPSRKKKK